MNWTYEEFLDKAVFNLNKMMPDGMEDVRIEKFHVNKPAGSYDGIRAMTTPDCAVCLNLHPYFDEIMQWETEDDRLTLMSHKLIEMREVIVDSINREEVLINLAQSIMSYDYAKDRLIPQLVSSKMPELNDYPHVKVPNTDLAVIYRISFSERDDGACTTVKYELMKEWGIDPETLERDAFTAAEKKFPLRIESMASVFNLPEGKNPLYIVNTAAAHFGASAILYPGAKEKIAEKLGGSYYVLPSSVHELLCISKDNVDNVNAIRNVVRTINDSMRLGKNGAAQDVLTDSVYFYNAETKKFSKTKEPAKNRDER